MLPDPTGWPISGGILAAGALYAGISMFATGPLVAERTIARMGWKAECARTVVARSEERREPEPISPQIDCGALAGAMLGEDGYQLCRQFGPLLNLPFAQVREQERRLHEANERRIAREAAGAGNRCACATTYTLEDNRFDFALYAGSLRLITPPAVRNLSTELTSALATPVCAMKEDMP